MTHKHVFSPLVVRVFIRLFSTCHESVLCDGVLVALNLACPRHENMWNECSSTYHGAGF